MDGVKINLEIADPNFDTYVSTGITIELIKCIHDFIDKVSLFGIFDLIAKMFFWPYLSVYQQMSYFATEVEDKPLIFIFITKFYIK